MLLVHIVAGKYIDHLPLYRLVIIFNLPRNRNRPIVVGRQNDRFAGSNEGATRAALFYPLSANAKNAGINPEKYFAELIRIINNHPQNRIDELF